MPDPSSPQTAIATTSTLAAYDNYLASYSGGVLDEDDNLSAGVYNTSVQSTRAAGRTSAPRAPTRALGISLVKR